MTVAPDFETFGLDQYAIRGLIAKAVARPNIREWSIALRADPRTVVTLATYDVSHDSGSFEVRWSGSLIETLPFSNHDEREAIAADIASRAQGRC